MKKGMIVLCTLIAIVSVLCLIKESKSVETFETKKNNPYEVFTFYKKDNLERYIKYKENNNLDYKDIVLRVNIGLDNSFYSNTKEIKEFDKLINIIMLEKTLKLII